MGANRSARRRTRPLADRLEHRVMLSATPGLSAIVGPLESGGVPVAPPARPAFAAIEARPELPRPFLAARAERLALRQAPRPGPARLATPVERPRIALVPASPAMGVEATLVDESAAWADRILELTNEQRRLAGVPGLEPDDRLMEMAAIQARQMAEFERMDHRLPGANYPDLRSRAEAAGYGYSRLGENIAVNWPDPEAALQSWMGSESHRRNLLAPDFTGLGVGLARGASGRPYVAQVFGRPATGP